MRISVELGIHMPTSASVSSSPFFLVWLMECYMQQSIYSVGNSNVGREELLNTRTEHAPAPCLLSIMLCQNSTAEKVQEASLPGSAGLEYIAHIDERARSTFFTDEVHQDGCLLVEALQSCGRGFTKRY